MIITAALRLLRGRRHGLLELAPLVVVLGPDVVSGLLNLPVQPRGVLSGVELPVFHGGVDHDEVVLDNLELLQLGQALRTLLHVLLAHQEVVLNPVLYRVQRQGQDDHDEEELHLGVALEALEGMLAHLLELLAPVELTPEQHQLTQ